MKNAEVRLNEMIDMFVTNFRGSSGYNDLIKELKEMPEPKESEYAALIIEFHGVQNMPKHVVRQLVATVDKPFLGHA